MVGFETEAGDGEFVAVQRSASSVGGSADN
jgi:hypothetical protein